MHRKNKKPIKKQNLSEAFIKSTLIVLLLLFCLLVIHFFHLKMAGNPDASANASATNSASSNPSTSPGPSGSPITSNGTPETGQKTADSGQPDSSQSGFGQKRQPTPAPAQDAALVFAGDVYFSDYVLAAYNQSGIRGVLSEAMVNELTQADLTMVNNEFPYSTRGTPAPDKQFTFRIDPSYISILKEAGVDIVTLANNHVLDYGQDALSDTFQTLDDAGIAYAGAGGSFGRAAKLVTKKAKGHTFGFLAASRVFPDVSWNVENAQPGVFSAYDPARLLSAVQKARESCDFLCVYVHWGIERSATPEEYQATMAHALIDAGADAVIGAHPHVLQGVEYYNGKPIFYSLGNFIFYQTTERTAIAKLTLMADNTAKWQLLPAGASSACTSLLEDAGAREDFYQYMAGLSVNARFTEQGFVTPK